MIAVPMGNHCVLYWESGIYVDISSWTVAAFGCSDEEIGDSLCRLVRSANFSELQRVRLRSILGRCGEDRAIGNGSRVRCED